MILDSFGFGQADVGVYADYECGEPRQPPTAANDNLARDLRPAFWMGVEITPTERVRSRAIIALAGGRE